MESTQLYAIAAGGILSIIILYHFCNYLVQLASEHALVFCLKHLFYPFMLARHRFVGPWTRSSAVKQCLFWALTAFCTVFRTSTLADAGTRAGMLSMINMIPLYSGLHLSFVADLLGVSVRAYTRIHGSLGVMTGALALFHAVVAVTGGRSTSQDTNIYTLMGGISLAALLLFSVRFFRRPSYEIFLRFHQALAGLLMFAVWHHTPRGGLPARIYKYTMAGSLVATSVVQGCQILLRNLSLGQAGSRASLTKVQGCVFIDINVPRPWKVRAGQYINIWMPFFSLRSIFQTHPFMIVYWTDGPCPSLHLLIEPKDGLTRKLYERAYEIRSFDLAQDYQPHDLPQQAFHLAWITGPHGRGAPVGEYGTVLMIATGFGIAAQLPYLKELIRGFNHCEVRTRRIHLVWQLDRIGDESGAVGILNQMLREDVKDKGYIFRISIYFASEGTTDGSSIGTEGANGRVTYHKGRVHLSNLVAAMMAGRCGTELETGEPEPPEKGRGKMLVTISADDKVRDEIRGLVKSNVQEGVRLMELDFQPSQTARFWTDMWKHF